MNLDNHILEAIVGHTRENPQDLPGIICHVDARMKLMTTHDELEGALRRLTSAGRVREVAHHKFIEADGDPTSHSFSGITIDEQHEAEEAYRRAFWKTYRSQQT